MELDFLRFLDVIFWAVGFYVTIVIMFDVLRSAIKGLSKKAKEVKERDNG